MRQITKNVVATEYWHQTNDGKIQCDVCPRFCKMQEGQRGFCFIRAAQNAKVVLTSYGHSSGFCIDPIEKKPLYHFFPGSPVLSFGTAGCNLGCKFCQNWDMSKSRQMDRMADKASPADIAKVALLHSCSSVAFTYNDPVIFLEYAIDTAIACHAKDIKNVAVTAGYITGKAREDFFAHIDAANVDLKSFNEDFYWKLTGAHLQDVLETLQYIHDQTNIWLEITTLLIPDENDSDREIDKMSEWIVTNLSPDVPLHFSAFHPDWKLRDKLSTPFATLTRARDIARKNGLNHVYTGNVSDAKSTSTYCVNCGALLIERDRYALGFWGLDTQGNCAKCQTPIAGIFAKRPGNWGSRYQRIRI